MNVFFILVFLIIILVVAFYFYYLRQKDTSNHFSAQLSQILSRIRNIKNIDGFTSVAALRHEFEIEFSEPWKQISNGAVKNIVAIDGDFYVSNMARTGILKRSYFPTPSKVVNWNGRYEYLCNIPYKRFRSFDVRNNTLYLLDDMGRLWCRTAYWDYEDNYDNTKVRHNIDFWGNDIRHYTLGRNATMECREKAFDTPQAAGYQYRASDGVCWLKHHMPNNRARAYKGMTSYRFNKRSDTDLFQLSMITAIEGANHRIMKIKCHEDRIYGISNRHFLYYIDNARMLHAYWQLVFPSSGPSDKGSCCVIDIEIYDEVLYAISASSRYLYKRSLVAENSKWECLGANMRIAQFKIYNNIMYAIRHTNRTSERGIWYKELDNLSYHSSWHLLKNSKLAGNTYVKSFCIADGIMFMTSNLNKVYIKNEYPKSSLEI